MNIQTAAKYMQVGHRIRRACWLEDRWFCSSDYEDINCTELVSFLQLENLLADDWEIVPDDDVCGFPI